MELKNLSSNWKALQQTLTASQPKAAKRKAPADGHDGTPRVSSKAGHKRAKQTKQLPSHSRASAHTPRSSQGGAASATNGSTAASAPASSASSPPPHSSSSAANEPLQISHPTDKANINAGLTPGWAQLAGKYVAVDCEMVGVGPEPGRQSMLARVSVVDYHGRQLYDSFVAAKERVTDYRTAVSGITAAQLAAGRARPLERVQRDIAGLLHGRVLVGHALRNDLDALLLGHPRRDIRDTARHPRFRLLVGGRTPGLRRLARDLLGLDIQSGAHSSVEDARATMALFRFDRAGFEREHVKVWGVDRRDWDKGGKAEGGKADSGGGGKRGKAEEEEAEEEEAEEEEGEQDEGDSEEEDEDMDKAKALGRAKGQTRSRDKAKKGKPK